jgi:ppGpp synthetase/RelA/SpoT-type nucleotidyltranferase
VAIYELSIKDSDDMPSSLSHPDEEAIATISGSGDPVDLRRHAQDATAEYLRVQSYYSDLADAVARILNENVTVRGIKIHSVQARSKDPRSFARKAASSSDTDPTKPKYANPLAQITDLAGVRVITQFLGTLSKIDEILNQEFDIVEKSNKGLELIEEDRFGYQSIHYLVRIKRSRTVLAEYQRFDGAITEVQVRTILQHAWAEIEHDIQYKSSEAIPAEIHRRFMALAGMLEIADREFQAIEEADRELEEKANTSVERGTLEGVEITPKALRSFLNKHIGPDGRMSDWNYDWVTRLLKTLGFRDLNEVQMAISPYDDHQVSIIAEGSRQGQISRFELMIEAALGRQYLLERHPFRSSKWYPDRLTRTLGKLEKAGLPLGTYTFPTRPESSEAPRVPASE